MAFDYLRLTEVSYIASTAGSIYSNPSSKKTYIRNMIIHNTNTTAELVTLYNVPDSSGSLGTAAAANQFYKQSIAPNETVLLEFQAPGLILVDTNDSVQAVTTTASKVTIQIYGGQE